MSRLRPPARAYAITLFCTSSRPPWIRRAARSRRLAGTDPAWPVLSGSSSQTAHADGEIVTALLSGAALSEGLVSAVDGPHERQRRAGRPRRSLPHRGAGAIGRSGPGFQSVASGREQVLPMSVAESSFDPSLSLRRATCSRASRNPLQFSGSRRLIIGRRGLGGEGVPPGRWQREGAALTAPAARCRVVRPRRQRCRN
jgi:hypothetical protein